MTLERHARVSRRHAGAVVNDLDQSAAGVLDYDADVGCSGIDGVFDQLLDHRSRTLDHFSGGYLVGHRVGK